MNLLVKLQGNIYVENLSLFPVTGILVIFSFVYFLLCFIL